MKVCLDATALMCLLDPRMDVFSAPDGSIVAIAQVARCERIVTGDPDVEKIAGRAAIETMFVWQLDLPPAAAQIAMQLVGGDGPTVE